METIVIALFIPAINRTFDVAMPSQLPICRYLENLANQISGIARTVVFDHAYPVLCCPQTGMVLPPQKSLADCGIRDAMQLMLV